ncbi:hypothetical protein POPTR_006G261111v4 [Populus trichocarpa]|uniref:Uncharacterized protein n=1 Tax=Populus trichocarpa TaxID=3694 RepID=A0ACC0SWJ2_POPTR|nr:hypothetical protein BDE02_06G229900 [Populus trichocarpa]KAI9393630.1 hypothetical protein POPTR_006G261111v4 [Populus trichocarpa]
MLPKLVTFQFNHLVLVLILAVTSLEMGNANLLSDSCYILSIKHLASYINTWIILMMEVERTQVEARECVKETR